MAKMTIAGSIQNTRNSEADAQGYALPPIASNLKDGQIAINTSDSDPCIFFKSITGKIVKIPSEGVLVKALTDILGNSAADLDTLRELIAQFEGSANDILPMLTALTDRVTAAETSLTSKADKSALNAHTGNTSNPHSVTKAQVGLSNVDNTADSAKPVSTAQATAIADAKKAGTDAQTSLTSHVDNKANPHGVTKAQVGLGNVLNKEQLGKDETAVNSEALVNTLNGCNVGVTTRHTLQFGTSFQKTSDDKAGINGFPAVNNANAVITMDMAAGNWFGQLGFSGNGQLYHRTFYTQDITNAKSTWALLYTSQNSNKSDVPWNCSTLNASGAISSASAVISPKAKLVYDSNGGYLQFGDSSQKVGFITGIDAAVLNNLKIRTKELNIDATDKSKATITLNNYLHGSEDAVKAGTVLGEIQFKKHSAAQVGASIQMVQGSDNSLYDGGLRFLTNGGSGVTTKMIIAPNGNIGVGTDNIKEALNVSGIIRTLASNYVIESSSTWQGWSRGLVVNRYDGVRLGGFFFGGTNGADMNAAALNIMGTDYLTINKSGIRVNGNVECTKTRLAYNDASGFLQFGDLNQKVGTISGLGGDILTQLVINSTSSYIVGKLGLGVSVASEKLDVNGNGKFSGNCYVGGNAGFGTNNPTDRVHSVGNVRATEKLIAGGNVESGGSGIFSGDVVAKKTNAVIFTTSDAAAGATRLNDLVDVKLPTTLSAKMVLAYDPAQVNSDGSKGGYTFMPSAGTGTGTVTSAEIASLPDHNHNDIVYASDERLKENVIPLRNATIMLNNLRPKEYNWNEKGIKLGLRDPKAYGLIAQEVEGLREIIDLVKPMHGGESGYLGVDYVKLVPVLIAGFQEQHKEIIALNQKLKTIQARANKAYGNETNNADRIVQLEAEIEELKMLIKK